MYICICLKYVRKIQVMLLYPWMKVGDTKIGFNRVMPPQQRFHFRHDNLKNILGRLFKFNMWVCMGKTLELIFFGPLAFHLKLVAAF